MLTQPTRAFLPLRSIQVSDLDGTMVGDGPEAAAMTAELAAYWEGSAALAGSVLVYNTGRSLGAFQGLLDGLEGALAVPDVLITAVGTKARAALRAVMQLQLQLLPGGVLQQLPQPIAPGALRGLWKRAPSSPDWTRPAFRARRSSD